MKEELARMNLLLSSMIFLMLIVSVTSSKLISLQMERISEVKSDGACMIENCHTCEPDLPYTCSKC